MQNIRKMSTPFEDGAGFEVGSEFTSVISRGTRLFVADIPAVNPGTPTPLQVAFPGTVAAFTIYPLQVGGPYIPFSTAPFWLVTPGGVANGDTILIPEAGRYGFTWKANVACTGGAAVATPYEIFLDAEPGPGQVAQPKIGIWADALNSGDQYAPTSYIEETIPGGYRWRLKINVVETTPAVINILTETRSLSIERLA